MATLDDLQARYIEARKAQDGMALRADRSGHAVSTAEATLGDRVPADAKVHPQDCVLCWQDEVFGARTEHRYDPDRPAYTTPA